MAPLRTIDSIVKDIEAQLETVRQEAGIIHNRERELRDEEDLDKFVDDDAAIRATLILDPGTREVEDEAQFKYFIFHDFRMAHYLEFKDDDETGIGFRDELEVIKTLFRNNSTIFGIPETPDVQRTLTEVSKELVEMGDFLIHEAIMTFTVETSEVKC